MNSEENEVAKEIVGYEGLYFITNMGRVWGIKFKKIVKPLLDKPGYYYIRVCKNCICKRLFVHRLIAIRFIENPNPNEYNMVDHINRVKTDNRIGNLRWCNQSLNNNNTKRKNTSSKY